MKLYRLAKDRFIRDLTGEGARLYGGRWNRKGTGVLYTAENRSLATVEYLVHLPMTVLPSDLFLAELTIPDGIGFQEIHPDKLPLRWRDYPAPSELADFGEEWVRRGEALLLRVPSSIVAGEWNFLVNPKHPLFDRVLLDQVVPFDIDRRLLRDIPGI